MTCPGPGRARTTRTILPGNWASVYITDLGNGNNECLLNLDTGEFQPQPTTWFKDQAAPRCPIIWAADHGMFFLQYGEVYYTEKGIGPDGLPGQLYRRPQ